MKRIALIIVAMLAIIPAWAKPKIVFEENAHDFGNIKEDTKNVSYDFRFVNEGDEPLVIISATAECGCTRPKYPMQPIAAGQEGVISVTFKPQGYKGEFIKEVKVKTNDKKAKTIRLRISGVVIPTK